MTGRRKHPAKPPRQTAVRDNEETKRQRYIKHPARGRNTHRGPVARPIGIPFRDKLIRSWFPHLGVFRGCFFSPVRPLILINSPDRGSSFLPGIGSRPGI